MGKVDQKWTEYAEGVLSGNIVAGKYIQLACQRYMDWITKRTDIFFDAERMERIENFIGHMKHFEGTFAGKPFILLPFQRWVIASIFAFYYVDDPEKRVVEEVMLFIARKNAKTALASAIILADMCVNKSAGYEAYLVAQSRDQAKIALKFLKGYSASLDKGCKKKHFKHYVNHIEYPKTGGSAHALASESISADGYNCDLALIDEFHAARDESMLQVMASSQGMKKNPLLIIISSGGYLMDGFPFYERVQTAHRELRGEGGVTVDDTNFYALFELDPDDDYTDPKNWIKANPSLGEIVNESFLKKRMKSAKTNMATQVDVKIKNLDIFVTARNIWIPPQILDKVCTKLDMEQLKGENCYMGVDLSSVSDLASISMIFPPNEWRSYEPDKWLIHTQSWVPQAALETSNGVLYEQFIHAGVLKMTPGNCIDYDSILKDIVEINNDYPIVKFMYDEWNATQFIQNLMSLNIVSGIGKHGGIEPMSQSLGSFNRATKTLEILINNEQCLIDSNQLVRFYFNNCELKFDSFGNCKPVKANDQIARKIDGVIAILMGMSGYLFEQLFNGEMEIITLDL